jgi:hypothetical protein
MIGRFFGLHHAETTGFGNITPHEEPDVQYGENQELTGANASINCILARIVCAFDVVLSIFELKWF